MARPTDDPSGVKRTVCISLAPRLLTKLDAEARARGTSRSDIITKLVERLTTKDQP